MWKPFVLAVLMGVTLRPAVDADSEPSAGVEVSPEVQARLERGEVVVTQIPPTDGTGYAYRSSAVVDAPPSMLWEVMRACDDIDEYMPRMLHAEERDHTPNSYICDTEIELPFPLANRTNSARSVLEKLPGGIFRRRWTLVDNADDYLRNNGSWTIYPWYSGEDTEPRPGRSPLRSLLVHKMDAWLKTSLPEVVIDMAQQREAPAAFQAIRRRVQDRRPDVAAAPPKSEGK